MYKGKSTTRSWATLPPEVIRLITTHYLLAMSATSILPAVWKQRECWPGRMVFTVVRDARMLEKLMQISPSWGAAIEYHLFWQQAAAVFDCADHILAFARAQRVSPFKHYRQNLYQRSCIPCRINYPSTITGLVSARQAIYSHTFGWIPACKDHHAERYCGICLRDASNGEICIAENEECEIWPQVEATCRFCREECLWKRCSELVRESEAIGGQQFAPDDWEARQTVDAFIEMGEGNVRDVIGLCMEKLWLRKHTKLADMMRLAVATSRMQSRMVENANQAGIAGGNMGEYEDDEDFSELDEEEEDPELMSITEETQGVRELAMNDWARNRILDGLWYSPADHWHHIVGGNNNVTRLPSSVEFLRLPYIPASHPVPWSLSQTEADREHPDPEAVCSPPPPSLNLCVSAFEAFRRQMRAVLWPAMVNVVRKIVMECAVDGADATVRVARMDVEDIANALRESGVWYNGVDWVERRKRQGSKDSDDSSSSEKSGSGATSPVLSTSTLQTTPSPPPASDVKPQAPKSPPFIGPLPPPSSSTHTRSPSSPIMSLPIAISPVLESPTQIASIPFIPNSMSEMPTSTMDTFKSIWRDACAPLFQCRCKICERSVMKANIEAGNIVPSQIYSQLLRGSSQSPIEASLVQVRIDSVSEAEEDSPVSAAEPENDAELKGRNTKMVMRRKRSCEAADIIDENGIEKEEEDDIRVEERNHRSKTPPEKRQRLGKHEVESAEIRLSMSPAVPPRSESESTNTASEAGKDVVRIVPEWGGASELDDEGLYVMNDVPAFEEET